MPSPEGVLLNPETNATKQFRRRICDDVDNDDDKKCPPPKKKNDQDLYVADTQGWHETREMNQIMDISDTRPT